MHSPWRWVGRYPTHRRNLSPRSKWVWVRVVPTILSWVTMLLLLLLVLLLLVLLLLLEQLLLLLLVLLLLPLLTLMPAC